MSSLISLIMMLKFLAHCQFFAMTYGTVFFCLFVCLFIQTRRVFRGWAKLRQGGGEGERNARSSNRCVCLTGAPLHGMNVIVLLGSGRCERDTSLLGLSGCILCCSKIGSYVLWVMFCFYFFGRLNKNWNDFHLIIIEHKNHTNTKHIQNKENIWDYKGNLR